MHAGGCYISIIATNECWPFVIKCSRVVSCMQYITTEDAESLEISRRHAGAGPETEIQLGGALVW